MAHKKKGKRRNLQTKPGTEVRHLGVLMEEMGDDIRLIAEQSGDMQRTLDGHGVVLSGLKSDIAVVKEHVAFIKNGLKTKVDVEEFAALERRVAALEKKPAH